MKRSTSYRKAPARPPSVRKTLKYYGGSNLTTSVQEQGGGDISSGRNSAGPAPTTSQGDGKEKFLEFDTPDQIEAWLKEGDNIYKYVYGLGAFLQFKEETVSKRLDNINSELIKLDEDFKASIDNYTSILGESGDEDDKSMMGVLQQHIQEQLAAGYETKYNELIQRKQSYSMVKKYIQNRRAYVVFDLQTNGGSTLIETIVKRASVIYEFYRGDKYKDIRKDIYELLNVITFMPASLKGSFQLNTVITGPAGSGKTTMARELSKWFSEIGLLTFDSFNENVDIAFQESGRANFIGEYTGQTAPKTIGVLYQSLEKTLFMDEAYSIAGCNFDRSTGKLEPDAYGEEFIAELLRFMNDHKGMSAIIIAGYKNLMKKCFMERNEGLPRRFPTNIDLPLSSTDELFNIFLRIVVEKSYDGFSSLIKKLETEKKKWEKDLEIKGDNGTLKKQIEDRSKEIKIKKDEMNVVKLNKLRFYCVMKPTFMMFHMDTTYHAIELLRKYMIVQQFRMKYTKETAIKLDNIYSYTIVTQVLISLLDTQLRRNLLRRQFYGEVFQFEDANLSYFKAQAGEMGLIADACMNSIEAKVKDGSFTVAKDEEEKLMNDYFYDKNIKCLLYEKQDAAPIAAIKTPVSLASPPPLKVAADGVKTPLGGGGGYPRYFMEVTKRDSTLEDFQGKINSFLNLESLFANLSSKKTPSKRPEPSKNIEDVLLSAKKDEAKEMLPSLLLEKRLESIPPGTNLIKEGEHIIDEIYTPAAKAPGAVQENERNPSALPSLQELYEILHNEEKLQTLTEHMVNMYFEKTKLRYVNTILGKIETDFPIHLQRGELETELGVLQNPKSYNTLLSSITTYNLKERSKRKDLNLQNSKQAEYDAASDKTTLKMRTLKSDILWEDIGFF